MKWAGELKPVPCESFGPGPHCSIELIAHESTYTDEVSRGTEEGEENRHPSYI